MAVIGFMGASSGDGIAFTVSGQTVRTLRNWTWSGSARFAVHNRHAGNALTEFVGLDPDKITFDIQLLREHGITPMQELLRLWDYERCGIAVGLVVGTHCYGKYRWTIVSHQTKVEKTDRRGNLAGAVVSVTLQEYLRA